MDVEGLYISIGTQTKAEDTEKENDAKPSATEATATKSQPQTLKRQAGFRERVFRLPEDADTSKVHAQSENGVLVVRIAKKARATAQRIPIK